jgi:hypothetical protein
MFEDRAGNTHRDKRDAVRADLALWLTATGTMNEASAKQLVDHMLEQPERLIELRDGILDLHRTISPFALSDAVQAIAPGVVLNP